MKEIAVALRFLDDVDSAPRIVSSGEGTLAEKIKQLAEKNGIEVVKDEKLAYALEKLPIGAEIPESLYKAVAILFRFLWEKDPSRK